MDVSLSFLAAMTPNITQYTENSHRDDERLARQVRIGHEGTGQRRRPLPALAQSATGGVRLPLGEEYKEDETAAATIEKLLH